MFAFISAIDTALYPTHSLHDVRLVIFIHDISLAGINLTGFGHNSTALSGMWYLHIPLTRW